MKKKKPSLKEFDKLLKKTSELTHEERCRMYWFLFDEEFKPTPSSFSHRHYQRTENPEGP